MFASGREAAGADAPQVLVPLKPEWGGPGVGSHFLFDLAKGFVSTSCQTADHACAVRPRNPA
jgi:hypothetical protein